MDGRTYFGLKIGTANVYKLSLKSKKHRQNALPMFKK